MSTDQHRVDAPREQVVVRWAVLEHAQAREQANIAAALVDFSDVPPAVALDLYYKVADRAAAPAGQPGAFPRNDLRGLDKFLRGELRFQLLHYKRDRRRAVPDPEDTLAATTAPSDPAREVEQREALRDIAQIVNDELSNADLTPAARAYFVADRIEGSSAPRSNAPRLERAPDQAITQGAARARRRVARMNLRAANRRGCARCRPRAVKWAAGLRRLARRTVATLRQGALRGSCAPAGELRCGA